MDKKIHTEPEDDIAVVCGLNSLLFIFLTNIRIPQPMSRPFTAMTGNRKYYLCLYEKKPHLTQSQGNHFDRLLAVSGARGEWPTISNIEPQRIPVRHRLPNQSIICLFSY